MTRRTVADEPKYYDFEIALTVDPDMVRRA
jgi:hypothetical protein